MGLGGRSLLIRTDANAQMGTGHLMRCLALAQAWQARGGEAIFITACDSAGLLKRLRDEGFQVVEVEECYPNPDEWKIVSQVLAAHPQSWVLLDGYHFDPSYQRHIKEAGHPLLVIDDMAHLDHYHADVVLNQNIHAEQLNYSCDSDTRLLLGTDYVLLRREFWPWRDWEREIPDVARKVLVTLGGSDPDNQTLKVIQALRQIEVADLEAVVIVGGSNPHFESLQSAVQGSAAIRLVRNVTNMPELMAWADIAVTAGGSTCWELAFMELPGEIIVLADNQVQSSKILGEQGYFVYLGNGRMLTTKEIQSSLSSLVMDCVQREQLRQRCNRLVDGQGVSRIINYLLKRREMFND